jgi:molybdopterin/thiamine biosynthesis adenylyltransferase/rhodanese-related sulfurtransferase
MDARFTRQIALPGFGARGQERLTAARVLVVGAGGLGSSVIPTLAAAGVGELGIIDDDLVELSNLHRQSIHSAADIGRAKVESAAAAVARANPDTLVHAIETRVTPANALELFADYDIVIDGSDNFATRYLVDDAASITGIPSVWGAVSQYGGQAGVSWAERGPTYRDLFPAPPPPGSVVSCEIGGVLPTVCAVIGSIMATEALKILSGVGTPLLGRVTTYDALTGGFREVQFERSSPAATELADYNALCGMPESLSALELAQLTDVTLVDVREPWEAAIASIPGSVLIPLSALESAIDELDLSKPVVIYCHSGVRSAYARAMLSSHGITASHLDGGIDAWAQTVDTDMARY